MEAYRRYALLSLGFGAAAFALVVFWSAESWAGEAGRFGLPVAWRQNVLLGTPAAAAIIAPPSLDPLTVSSHHADGMEGER